jgi:hypothetical protein
LFSRTFASVDSKELVLHQNNDALCFAKVANEKLRPTGRLQKTKNASGMLAVPDAGAMLPSTYCTRGVIDCQEKKREQFCDI